MSVRLTTRSPTVLKRECLAHNTVAVGLARKCNADVLWIWHNLLMLLRRALFVLLYFTFTISLSASDRFNSDQLKSVLRVETAPDAGGNYDIGTGFLLATDEQPSGKVLLITNKHMIGDWNYADANIASYTPYLNIYFYRINDPSGQTFRARRVDLMHNGTLDA
jgi:hypothetical protein